MANADKVLQALLDLSLAAGVPCVIVMPNAHQNQVGSHFSKADTCTLLEKVSEHTRTQIAREEALSPQELS